MTKILKKQFINLIKFVIICCSFVYIYFKFKNNNLTAIFDFKTESIFLLFFAILLMFVNWSLEAVKWKYLNKNEQNLTFIRALKSVLVGLTIGLLTPNRLGEPIARGLVFERKFFKNTVINATIGSIAQFLTTLFFGTIGLLYFLNHNLLETNSGIFFLFAIMILVSGTLFIYFNFQRILKLKFLQNIFQKKGISLNEFEKSRDELLKVLILSILRYFTFILQNFLLLVSFSVNVTIYEAFFSVSAVYIIINLLPSFFIADLGIRGTAAIFFISFFSNNIKGIIFATFVLWIINILMPAILGQIIIFRSQFSFFNSKSQIFESINVK